jgi:hypothetical protein
VRVRIRFRRRYPVCSKLVRIRRDGKLYAHVFGVKCAGPDSRKPTAQEIRELENI